MTTLYEQNPAAWDNLAKQGRPSLRDMSRHFTKCSEMNAALDCQGASHWLAGRNSASMKTERKAKEWRDQNAGTKPSPLAAPSATLFLVSAQNGNADRARKLLEMIGCEVVEV